MEQWVSIGGEKRRAHKEYVDVVARCGADGFLRPLAVCWPDGRTFPVDEVLRVGEFGPPVRGRVAKGYRVRVGGRETDLYLERGVGAPEGSPDPVRWFVFAVDKRGGGSN